MKIKAKVLTIGILMLTINILGLFLIYQSVANPSYYELENNSNEYQKFFGEWHKYAHFLKESEHYIFRADGSFSYIRSFHLGDNITQNGTYEIQNSKLILKYENSTVQIFTYIFFEQIEFTFIALFDSSVNLDNQYELGDYTWYKTY